VSRTATAPGPLSCGVTTCLMYSRGRFISQGTGHGRILSAFVCVCVCVFQTHLEIKSHHSVLLERSHGEVLELHFNHDEEPIFCITTDDKSIMIIIINIKGNGVYSLLCNSPAPRWCYLYIHPYV